MRTPYTFIKMNNRLLLALMLTIIISMFSCEKEPVFKDPDVEEPVTDDPNIVPVDVPKVSVIIDEIIINKKYFSEDSVKNFDFTTYGLFGQDTITFNLLTNLGLTRDTAGNHKDYIFKRNRTNSDPIFKYKIDEFYGKKIIISWDFLKKGHLVDSITTLEPNYSRLHDDSYKPIKLNWPFDTIIDIDIFVLYRFGKVELDIENPKMNDFLKFKSSKYNGLSNDSINWLPKLFYNIFGNEYLSSMTLGNLSHFSMSIRKIDYTSDKKYEIINEAHMLIKKSLNENISWDILKQSSTYFKHSIVSGMMNSAYGEYGSTFIDDFIDLNKIFDCYKAAEFGVLASEYKPFNTIYPKYKFLY